MSLQAADFTTAVAIGNTNPSVFGYHHGPIPNPNPGWVPERIRIALANGITRPPALNAQDVANPPNPASVLSSINTLVCDIDLGGGQMCGRVFGDQPTYRRHVRTFHPGAVTNPARKNTSIAENLSGSNAIKSFVVTQGWRNARYLYEPGRGSKHIAFLCDEAERIAAEDPDFAAEYGTVFHRSNDPSRGRHSKARSAQDVPPSPSLSVGIAHDIHPRGRDAPTKSPDCKSDQEEEEELGSDQADPAPQWLVLTPQPSSTYAPVATLHHPGAGRNLSSYDTLLDTATSSRRHAGRVQKKRAKTPAKVPVNKLNDKGN